MMRFNILLFFIAIILPYMGICQDSARSVNLLFYNVENLFDTLDDPHTRDNEFTPNGSKKWDSKKYEDKLTNIYKVIMAAGKWNPPAIIGLAEVENKQVLTDLINETPLKKLNYSIIHYNSQDQRGIDVALLYRSDIFSPICSTPIYVNTPHPTRDILLFSGKIANDTIHFFVNHWPSRISGKEHTEKLRVMASQKLISAIDSICQFEIRPKIIVMGDFNDEPIDKSLKLLLERKFHDKRDNEFNLVGKEKIEGEGTTVYTDVFKKWYFFDQILISNNIEITNATEIVKLPWLLNYRGDPDRTYLGDYYNDGISDHLPIIIEISTNTK